MSEQIQPKSGWSTTKKVFIGLGLLFTLLFVGCSALVVGAASTSTPTAVETEDPTVRNLKELEKDLMAKKSDDAIKNVEVTSCDYGEFGLITIEYSVDNPTSKNSDYFIDFDVVDQEGVKVSGVVGMETNVTPGRLSRGEAVGSVSDSAKEPLKCSVAEVTRTESL